MKTGKKEAKARKMSKKTMKKTKGGSGVNALVFSGPYAAPPPTTVPN